MRYIALIYGDETWFERQSGPDREAHLRRWDEFSEAVQAAGVIRDGARLAPTPTAKTVRRRGGPLVSDGPFAETREQLCGYLVLDVDSVEEAVTWAERCPATLDGSVEVRPAMPE